MMVAMNTALSRFSRVFPGSLPKIIGMIHVQPLPGTPSYKTGHFQDIIKTACHEAESYQKAGVDSILIENMHDIPYLNRNVGPEIVASMAAVCYAVKQQVSCIPCGVQILAGCNKEALAVAKSCGLDFIRAEGYVFGHVADEGLMNSDAGELLRYRKAIDAEDVLVFTDIKKKHSSHAITKDVSLTDTASAAKFFLSDGLIITGTHTGAPTKPEELEELKREIELPVIVGSGVTSANLKNYVSAHALIIGSYFKEGGKWQLPLDMKKVQNFLIRLKDVR